eukprot:5693266-Karenia_brevis.AAC.1
MVRLVDPFARSRCLLGMDANTHLTAEFLPAVGPFGHDRRLRGNRWLHECDLSFINTKIEIGPTRWPWREDLGVVSLQA